MCQAQHWKQKQFVYSTVSNTVTKWCEQLRTDHWQQFFSLVYFSLCSCSVSTAPLSLFSCFPAATEAEKDGVPVFKFPRWRVKGQAIPEVVAQYKATAPELNVLPFCSQFIPMEVIDYPKHGSIIYHPSLLPRHRGASAINWWVMPIFVSEVVVSRDVFYWVYLCRTLIHGDKKGGFTVFWADDGLDTGPILLQRECDVEPNDTVNSIYKRFLFPEGVKGTVSVMGGWGKWEMQQYEGPPLIIIINIIDV